MLINYNAKKHISLSMQYGINHDKNKNERRFIIYKCFRAQEIQLDFNPFSFYKAIFKTQSLS